MKQTDLDQLAAAIESFNPGQRRQLLERWQHPEALPQIIEHLEQQLKADLKCPRCDHDRDTIGTAPQT